jgi:hypothetical protein
MSPHRKVRIVCIAGFLVLFLFAPRSAAAFDVSVSEVFAQKPSGAKAPPHPSTQFQQGDHVDVYCVVSITGLSKGGPQHGYLQAQLMVDGNPFGNPHPLESGFGKANARFLGTWMAVAGVHRLGCRLDPLNQIPESDETNNEKEIVVTVGPISEAGSRGRGRTPIPPVPRLVACRSTLAVLIQAEPTQFSPSHENAEGPQTVSFALADSQVGTGTVRCGYRNAGQDLEVFYTQVCPNASPTGAAHSYTCH